MKRKLPWLLLLVSVALNVFFVGGALYSMVTSERLEDDPAARTAFVAERLALAPAEREALIDWRQRARDRFKAMRAERGEMRAQVLQELAKAELDPAALERLMSERAALRVPALLETVQDLHGYLATLSPEQKAEFIAMAQEREFFRRIFGRPPRRADAR